MSLVLDATLALPHPQGALPAWIVQFKKAVMQLELLLRKHEDRTAERDGEDGNAEEERERSQEEEMASIGDAEANLRSVSRV